MIFLPYLSQERLAELKSMAVSGIDLCANGIVYVPNRICVVRTGQPNLYPDSRPVANPFSGRSGLVARMLIEKPRWETLSELTEAFEKHAHLKGPSLSQVSKSISAYTEALLVLKDGNNIRPLFDYDKQGRAMQLAVPTPEHCLPLLYILGLRHNPANHRLFEYSTRTHGEQQAAMFAL